MWVRNIVGFVSSGQNLYAGRAELAVALRQNYDGTITMTLSSFSLWKILHIPCTVHSCLSLRVFHGKLQQISKVSFPLAQASMHLTVKQLEWCLSLRGVGARQNTSSFHCLYQHPERHPYPRGMHMSPSSAIRMVCWGISLLLSGRFFLCWPLLPCISLHVCHVMLQTCRLLVSVLADSEMWTTLLFFCADYMCGTWLKYAR